MQSKAIWQSHQPILPMGIALVLVTLHAATCVAGILVDFNDATDANDLAIGGVVWNVVPNVPGSIFESDDFAKSQGGSSNIDLRVNGNWQDTFCAVWVSLIREAGHCTGIPAGKWQKRWEVAARGWWPAS